MGKNKKIRIVFLVLVLFVFIVLFSKPWNTLFIESTPTTAFTNTFPTLPSTTKTKVPPWPTLTPGTITPTAVLVTVSSPNQGGGLTVGDYGEKCKDSQCAFDINTKTIGHMRIEYPQYIEVKTTRSIVLIVNVPELPKGASNVDFERIMLPVDYYKKIEPYGIYNSDIFVANWMYADLTTAGVASLPANKNLQDVDVHPGGDPTIWTWLIEAPDSAGIRECVMSVYLGDKRELVWQGVFEISVILSSQTSTSAPPTQTHTPIPPALTMEPTSTLTATPISFVTSIGDNIREDFVAFLGVLLTFIAAIVGIYYQFVYSKEKTRKPKSNEKKRNTK
jgi:hypothetical protein